MMISSVTPERFIGRVDERELFRQLVQGGDEGRVLMIEAAGGTGKSTLLQMLRHECDRELSIPSSFIDLQLSHSSFMLVWEIRKELAALPFANFDKVNQARLRKDFKAIVDLTGGVDLRRRPWDMQEKNAPPGRRRIPTPNRLPRNGGEVQPALQAEWTSDYERISQERSILQFLEDLKRIGDNQPLVLLFDSYERCNHSLDSWMTGDLLGTNVLDPEQGPSNVVLVLAGRRTPELSAFDSGQRRLVRSRTGLSSFVPDDVRALLRWHVEADPDDQSVSAVLDFLAQGGSLQTILQVAELDMGRAG